MRLITLFLSGFIIYCTALSAAAYDFPSICIKEKNGTEHIFTTDGFQFTYTDGTVTVGNFKTTDAAPLSFLLTELELMKFSTQNTSSINETPIDQTGGNIEVYSTDGILIGSFASLEEARARLSSAIYIVKSASGVKIVAL